MNRRYTLILTVSLLVVSQPSKAQVSAALDTELQHTLDSMRMVLGAKSLSAAIQTSDGSTWAHANGISAGSPLTNTTVNDAFLIGSVTKTITSACILQLADEGVLNLDDSLHEWLPAMPYIDSTITIRQLLNHTSGIYDVLSHPHNQDSLIADMSRIWTPEELIDRFIAPPVFQPGASWSYCNTNYFLLGMIIREATGNEFYTELRNRFYIPLALNSFAIPAFEQLNSPVAHLWLDITGDGIQDDAHDFYMNYLSLNSTAGAAGGYFSTPTDCTKWMRSYLRGDLLSPAIMAEAKTTVPAGSNIERYGLGLMHKTNGFLGHEAYGHGGDLAYHASSWYFPEFDQSITVFTNDNTETSWTLLPVVRELLRTYIADQTASLDENQLHELKISPVPFSDRLVVSWKSQAQSTDFTLTLQDAAGRTLSEQKETTFVNGHFESRLEELGSLPSGVYFVQISSKDGSLKTIKTLK